QCCDVARTYLFESATQEMLDAYSAIVEAQEAIISNIASGVAVSTLDGLLQSHLSEYIIRDDVQHSYFWGHGIGEFTIMEPILSNETGPITLEEDQILGIQVYLLFDAGWFVRVEDTCLVTAGGVEVLSGAPKALEDMLLLSNSSVIEVDTRVERYSYFNGVSVNSTVMDSANRSILGVSYFDGMSWAEMIDQGTRCFTHQYSLNTEYPSFVAGLVRVQLPDTTVYSSIHLDAKLNATYDEVLDPKVVVVVEGVTTEERMTWTFSKMGADMIQLHFLKVYPPPGDQFLVKDLDGNVVFEYKWNLGAEATSPWVPGCAAVVEVVPQWMSVYGGVNHFFFEVDIMGIYDPEATATTSTTSETSSSSLTTAASTTSSTSGTYFVQGRNPLILAGLAAGVLVLLAFFLRRKQ
ncbi:M24 family metallopeptidase, partial [Candidatus Thorarchaeota archaeon]